MGWGALIGAAIGAGGSMLSASSSSRSQRRADEANNALARETNEQNRLFFDQSRGSAGNALLPLYLGGAESELGQMAANSARSIFTARPGDQIAANRRIVDGFMPSIEAGDREVADLFSGGRLNGTLGDFAPVAEARTGRARAASSSIDNALSEVLSKLDTALAGRGFMGGSSFGNSRLFGSTLGARSAAAEALSQASLDNALQEFDIRSGDRDLRLASLDLPAARAASRIALEDLPAAAYGQSIGNAMAPLSFFRMGQGEYRANPLPQQSALTGTGQIVGSALSSAGNAIGNYAMYHDMQRRLDRRNQNQNLPEVQSPIY